MVAFNSNDPFAAFSESEVNRASDFTAAIMRDIVALGPIPCLAVILAARTLGLPVGLVSVAMGVSQSAGLFSVLDPYGEPCLPSEPGALVHLSDSNGGDPSLN